jgi:hypothetical protein
MEGPLSHGDVFANHVDQTCNTHAQREKATERSSGLRKFVAPHIGQSSQLFLDANHGHAQFLRKPADTVGLAHKTQEL